MHQEKNRGAEPESQQMVSEQAVRSRPTVDTQGHMQGQMGGARSQRP